MEQTKRRACYEVLHALRPGMATIPGAVLALRFIAVCYGK
jgi:hypothetical protein